MAPMNVRRTVAVLTITLITSLNCVDDLGQVVIDPPSPSDSAFSIHSPFWSSDGRYIVFFGNVFGREGYDLYRVDSTGGQAQIMNRDSLAKSWPRLSPDGSKIAFLAAVVGRLQCCAHVWVMNSDGTNARDLTPFFSKWEQPRWSPDSRFLIFSGPVEDSGSINYQIVRSEIATGAIATLTSGNYGNLDASYTFDGRHIVYTSGRTQTEYGGKVWKMNADGTGAVPIDTTSTASTYPRPSPTTNEIQFGWGLGGESDAGTYSVDLGITVFPSEPNSFVRRRPEIYLNLAQWSPAGDLIAFVLRTTAQTNDLFLIDGNGANMRQITQNMFVYLFSNPWSPDSAHLIFQASDRQDGSIAFFRYDLVTGSIKKLAITKP
ncbi:MAG: TolB family protein [Bacteroidota bacterium]